MKYKNNLEHCQKNAISTRLKLYNQIPDVINAMSKTDFNDVMATVAKVINFLVKRSALTHRRFRSLLEEMDSAYPDLPLHSAVRWLSCGKVLERFVSCLDAIKVFLAEKGQHYPQLEDETWIVKLLFLADITGHLNDLNLRLQGAGQTVLDMFETWTRSGNEAITLSISGGEALTC